ncbi:hypothetical protein [Aporhodopirellula aestuarii]|uniref:Uncharacterized protein n=1 Tax=Aporhodopirellula aestuarii TaxID=2950107 RepID=A0ABT0TZP5_9BACT|nr:hypothetical protein [Aporhodopirellula aestuarii]MCM2369971.1 hypothetical protein [Aporhodopirellula aestuarii]
MSNSLSIRIAVNLCLIAVMVIQPMAIAVAQTPCAQASCFQEDTVCHACKCCEVKTAGQLCGCCRGKVETTEDTSHSCCRKSKSPEPEVVEDAGTTPVLRVCTCGIRSEPVAPAPIRVPVPQVRDLEVVAYLDHVGLDESELNRPYDVTSRLPIGDLAPHFSQRFLCVWRI